MSGFSGDLRKGFFWLWGVWWMVEVVVCWCII